MKSKFQTNPSHSWDFTEKKHKLIARDRATILPSITMKTSEFWPIQSGTKPLPYAGPTLWTPRYSKASGDKQPFLTLTPTKHLPLSSSLTPSVTTATPSSSSSSPHYYNRTIPLVSLTPQIKDFTLEPIYENHLDFESRSPVYQKDTSNHPKLSKFCSAPLPPIASRNYEAAIANKEHYCDKDYGDLFNNKTIPTNCSHKVDNIRRRKKKTQSPISPDVFSLETLNKYLRKSDVTKHNAQYPIPSPHNVHESGKHGELHKLVQNENANFDLDKTDNWLSEISNGSHAFPPLSVHDKNEQDTGTLYSQHHRINYSHLIRDPTFLPMIKRDLISNNKGDINTEEKYKTYRKLARPQDTLQFSSSSNELITDDSNSKTGEIVQNKGPKFSIRLSKHQLKERSDYIKSHAHHTVDRKSSPLSCQGQQATPKDSDSYKNPNPNNINPETQVSTQIPFNQGSNHTSDCMKKRDLDRQIPKVANRKLSIENHKNTDAENLARRLENIKLYKESKSRIQLENKNKNSNRLTGSHETKQSVSYCPHHHHHNHKRFHTNKLQDQIIAAEFCDVLGQKSCHRCQEFYQKNFTQPAREKVERIRSPAGFTLSRESTIMMPSGGLQKVVIRVKDDKGDMAVAIVGINPGVV